LFFALRPPSRLPNPTGRTSQAGDLPFAPIVNSKPDAELLSDLDSTVAWAKSQGGDTSRLGIIGFCRGGRTVWEYSAHSPMQGSRRRRLGADAGLVQEIRRAGLKRFRSWPDSGHQERRAAHWLRVAFSATAYPKRPPLR